MNKKRNERGHLLHRFSGELIKIYFSWTFSMSYEYVFWWFCCLPWLFCTCTWFFVEAKGCAQDVPDDITAGSEENNNISQHIQLLPESNLLFRSTYYIRGNSKFKLSSPYLARAREWEEIVQNTTVSVRTIIEKNSSYSKED